MQKILNVEYAGNVNSVMFIWVILCILFGGYLSDKIGYYNSMISSSIFSIIMSIPLYMLIYYINEWYSLMICQLIFGISFGLYAGPLQIFMIDSIDDVLLRYTVIAFSYNLCQVIFGGTAPLIGQALSNKFNVIAVGIYIVIFNLWSLILVYIKKRQNGSNPNQKWYQNL
mmetsp:Transcript_78486/g.96034  ORF Transcript_78486/g.96034 Transcript_78486/m.96034 type:complete len:170 (-) Transcript_78486:39-548(-)